jgi:undecaprenyl-diphosphatase
MIEWLKEIDKIIFLWLNFDGGAFTDSFMTFASSKYFNAFILIPLLYFWIKALKLKFFILLLYIIIIITLSDQGSVHLFKNVFERLRPCHAPELEGLVHLVNNKCGGLFGFISSHASNTAAVVTFVIFLMNLFRNKTASVLILTWLILVGYSRIYLGAHYPFDVIAGWLFGMFIGFLVWTIFKRIHPSFLNIKYS